MCGMLGDDFVKGGDGDDTLFGDLCGLNAKLAGAQAAAGGNDRINGGRGRRTQPPWTRRTRSRAASG